LTNCYDIIIIIGDTKVKGEEGEKMKDLTKGNIYKVFFSFGLPLVLSGLLSQFYGIVDTAIAGQIFGDVGLAAIGATNQLNISVSSESK
jgi:Na+-driven multidrug efflux pump